MKRILILALAVLLFSPVGRCGDAAPLALKATTAAPAAKAVPQSLLDALEAVERDRIAIIMADTSLGIASQGVAVATRQRAEASASMAVSQAAFLRIYAEIYGVVIPPPPPTPPVPPEPPVPDPPVPPAPTQPTLLLITASGAWCDACNQLKSDTLPGLKTTLGPRLTVVDYTDPMAKAYSESALVPRWVLTRPDGKTEKLIGYKTVDQINAWLKGVSK